MRRRQHTGIEAVEEGLVLRFQVTEVPHCVLPGSGRYPARRGRVRPLIPSKAGEFGEYPMG